VIFESLECLHCGSALGFDWQGREIERLDAGTPCANRDLARCNGLSGADGLCFSCALTRKRANDKDVEGRERFTKAEAAKRRLLFSLLELGLPVVGRHERHGGLAFDLLNPRGAAVTTGHADGLITLDLAEADDAHRERTRVQMGEPYRTLLGHLRHEIAHFYESVLCPRGSRQRARFRELFGDERADYQAAMDRHYAQGPPGDWPGRFASAYATMHPWEDWAETFAHYLHIRDTLQTSVAYGVNVVGPVVLHADEAPLHSSPGDVPNDIRGLLDIWLPLTYALNALNRSMGANDIYPFVLAPAVVEKLGFIHELVRDAGPQAETALASWIVDD